jgi:hypothetical protein
MFGDAGFGGMIGSVQERRPAMKSLSTIVLAMLGLTAAGLPCAAQPGGSATPPSSPASTCFYINQFNGWRAPDDKTIFIRVNLDRYYRLDLSGTCAMLKFADSHLITKTRGPDTVCSAVDWDLSVAQSSPGSIPEPCIVKTMTLLSPAEVAAIPPKYKP